MSVRKYTPSELANLAGNVKDKHKQILHSLSYHPKFLKEERFRVNLPEKQTKNDIEIFYEMIDSLFIHLWKANLFCFAAQYHNDAPGIVEELQLDEWPDLGERKINSVIVSLPEGASVIETPKLVTELRQLDYNLATNDGNHFVDPEWYSLFQKIIELLTYEAARPRIHPEES